jgi:hypothetical protein
MRRLMDRTVRPFSLATLVSIALCVGGAGWAVQGDHAAPPRPEKQRPILLACTADQAVKWNACVDGRLAACVLLQGSDQQRQVCRDRAKPACTTEVGFQC